MALFLVVTCLICIKNFQNWLDLSKTIIKQVKDVDPLVLSFRIKFYPADPGRMSLNGKYMVFQQLKRDLRHGRLYCSLNEGATLASLIIQGKFTDRLNSSFVSTQFGQML